MSQQQMIDEHVRTGLHEKMKLDEAQWAALEFVGESMGLVWKNCPCGSTLARLVQS